MPGPPSDPLREHLCLDFVNTVDPRGGTEDARDSLVSARGLVNWAESVEVVEHGLAGAIRADAERHPRAAANALGRVRAARESLYSLLRAVAEGSRPDERDVHSLSDWVADARANAFLAPTADRLAWRWPDTPHLARCTWPVAAAAADLVTGPLLQRVGVCGSRECAWLFLDTSKNHSRRWCRMSVCGNAEKSRRFLSRRRTVT